MVRPKFKYIPLVVQYDLLDLEEDFDKADNPFPQFPNLPEGEYLIRGNKSAHRKKYWKVSGEWYLIEDVTKDNGHYNCDSSTYNLFPSLPDKEWQKIEQIGFRRLNKVWQRHLYGYNQWMHLRELRRDIHKSMKIWKE